MGVSDWNLLAAGSAAAGIGLAALVASSRRRTRRRAAVANTAVESEPRRRIDVVAIDEEATRALKQEAKP